MKSKLFSHRPALNGCVVAAVLTAAGFVLRAFEQPAWDVVRSQQPALKLESLQGALGQGVTVGLLHGSCPDALILCHQASRKHIGDYRDNEWLPIPPLTDYIKMYEMIGSAVHPTKVIGIALNTYDLSGADARAAIDQAARDTGLPAADVVRFGSAPLVEAIAAARPAGAKVRT